MGRTECELNIARKVDSRNRIEAGLYRISVLQYFCYFVISGTVTIIAGVLLFSVEVNNEC